MCGIAGFVECGGSAKSEAERTSVVQTMAAQLEHRGPDQAASLIWNDVTLAFRRLSINDLSNGSQPFHSPDGGVSAFVNGELYNHRELRHSLQSREALRSESDCEVLPFLIAEHGLQAFELINGMFAAAVLDRQHRTLILARDRMGIKPLFYACGKSQGHWIFASEIKALLAHPDIDARFDWRSALQWGGWAMADREELPSHFHGIQRVPSGGIVRIDLESGEVNVQRYWRLEAAAAQLAPPMRSETPERFRELLADSVRARLMADAGVGLFLSGGIDSVAIAGLAAAHEAIPTFSVWNDATLASGDAGASRQAAEAFGLPNHAVQAPLDDAPTPDDWRNLLWACELPTITAEQWFKFRLHAYARQLDPSLKVILLGQGADEFLGGYLHWLTGIRQSHDRGAWQHVEHALATLHREQSVSRAAISPAFIAWFEAGWLDAGCLAGNRTNSWAAYRQKYRTNLDYHLWHEDRTAAAHGIENRVPFLDHRLLEFLATIPATQHARWFTDKRLLRTAMEGVVPAPLLHRPKGYFFYGSGQVEVFRLIAQLLRANSGALLDQALVGSQATGGPLTAQGLRAMADQVLEDPAHRGMTQLLFLVNMGVLAHLAHERATLPFVHAGDAPAALNKETIQQALQSEAESPYGVAVDDIHQLASGLSLMEMRRTADKSSAAGTLTLVEAGRLFQDVNDSEMATYLCEVDGERSLSDIARQHQLDLPRLQTTVAEALELGILARVDREA
ncbi:MAG: asparagine synthase (glutamine-hydrolyzing) [Pseudomonadota bacterium]